MITEKQVSITRFVSSDGKEFADRAEAEQWEASVNKTLKVFLVRFSPDLTEGRGLMKRGLIKVAALGSHRAFAEHVCYGIFGNQWTFVQGVFGSNAIVHKWSLTPLEPGEIDHSLDVIATVQDKFATPHLFPVGIDQL